MSKFPHATRFPTLYAMPKSQIPMQNWPTLK